MSFEGRYYTENKILVAVHLAKNLTELVVYEGHDVKGSDLERWLYKWDKQGNCVAADNQEGGIVEGLNAFDLVGRVNPQSMDDNIEVLGCEDCKLYQERKKGIKRTESSVVREQPKQEPKPDLEGQTIVTRMVTYIGPSGWVEKTLQNSLREGRNLKGNGAIVIEEVFRRIYKDSEIRVEERP